MLIILTVENIKFYLCFNFILIVNKILFLLRKNTKKELIYNSVVVCHWLSFCYSDARYLRYLTGSG